MTAAVYARVSTTHQDRETQLTAIRKYLTDNKIEVPKERWYEDQGWSRTDAERRPAFQRLIAAVEGGAIKKVIVLALDRWGTSDAFEQAHFFRILYKAGCELLSVTEPGYGNVAKPDMITTILATVASARSTDELQARGRRNHQGKVPAALRGFSAGGLPPLGYDWLCIGPDSKEKWRLFYQGYDGVVATDDGVPLLDKKGRPVKVLHRVRIWPDGKREPIVGFGARVGRDTGDMLILVPSIDADRIETVRWIFNKFTTEDITPGEIARQLTLAGKKPPTQEGAYYGEVIRNTLKNEAFCTGSTVYNKESGASHFEWTGGQVVAVPQSGSKLPKGRKKDAQDHIRCNDRPDYALVSRAVWEKAQTRLAAGTRGPRPAKDASMWLTGLVTCGTCGLPMQAKKQAEGYSCATYDKFKRRSGGKGSPCRNHPTPHAMLEEVVEKYLDDAGERLEQIAAAPPATILGMADQWWEENRGNDTRSGYSTILPPDHPTYAAAKTLDDGAMKYVAMISRVWKEVGRKKARGDGTSWTHDTLTEEYRRTFSERHGDTEARLEAERATLKKLARKALLLAEDAGEALRREIRDLLSEQEAVVRELEGKLVPLDKSLDELRDSLTGLRSRFEEARRMVLGGSEGEFRQKAAALKAVVAKIIVRHVPKGKDRSEIVGVEVVPVSGVAREYSGDNFRNASSGTLAFVAEVLRITY